MSERDARDETPRERARREKQEADDAVAEASAEQLKALNLRADVAAVEGPQMPGRPAVAEASPAAIRAAAKALMDLDLRTDSSPAIGPRDEITGDTLPREEE